MVENSSIHTEGSRVKGWNIKPSQRISSIHTVTEGFFLPTPKGRSAKMDIKSCEGLVKVQQSGVCRLCQPDSGNVKA